MALTERIGKMRVEIKIVTPSMAESFLLENNSNRKLNKPQLDMLVRTIKAGNWALTHQGVAIYDDGTLADGQHRLSAIVESGIACMMPVFYGVEKTEKTVMAVDCGKLRSVTDSSAISGNSVRASDVSLAKAIEYGMNCRAPRLTHQESSDLCKKHASSLDMINILLPSNRAVVSSVPIKAALVKAKELGVDLELLKSICEVLYTGEYVDTKLTGAVRLRNKLFSIKAAGSGTAIDMYSMVLNTCMKINRGDDVKTISKARVY